jgi:hypothetical protein
MPGAKLKSIKNPADYEKFKAAEIRDAKKPISKATMQAIKTKAARITNWRAGKKRKKKKGRRRAT